MKLPTGTVVALADGGRQLLLINRGDESIINLRFMEDERQETPPDRELGHDRPGRFHARKPEGGGAEKVDLHERAEQRFGSGLIRMLRDKAGKGELRHLVIAADPDTLGELRGQYDDRIRRALLAEIPRDLLKLSLPDIEKAITTWQAD